MWRWERALPLNLAKYVTRDAYGFVQIPTPIYEEDGSPLAISKALFESLCNENIRYCLEPYSESDTIQTIRGASEVIGAREGTCIDLSILFAGLCMDYRLLPLLIIFDGHAFVAVSTSLKVEHWNSYGRFELNIFNNAVCADKEKLWRLIEDGVYIPIECTGFARAKKLPTNLPESTNRDTNGLLSFEHAIAAAKNSFSNPNRSFQYAIDLAGAKLGQLILPEVRETQAQNRELSAHSQSRKRQLISPFGSDLLSCPYPGLEPINLLAETTEPSSGLSENASFFGRASVLNDLKRSLLKNHFVIVIGSSGCGKTSLVQGGLVQALRSVNSRWEFRTFRPQQEPYYELSSALNVAGKLDHSAYSAAVQNLLSASSKDSLLLIVDQLEELFALKDRKMTDEFIGVLIALSQTGKCDVVATIRADFYEELTQSEHWSFITSDGRRIELGALSRDDIEEVIKFPAESMGVRVEPALISMLQDDCAGEPGYLPFLQSTLVMLWKMMSPTDLTLTADSYLEFCEVIDGRRSNGLEHAIQTHASLVFNDKEFSEREKAIFPLIFLSLVNLLPGRKPSRRQLPLVDLLKLMGKFQDGKKTVERLVHRRLLTQTGELNSSARIDIAHDSLLSGWDRLKGWLKEFEDEKLTADWLSEKTKAFMKANHSPDTLLSPAELQRAETWLNGRLASLMSADADIQALIKRSEKAVSFRRNISSAVLVVILSLLAGMSVLATLNYIEKAKVQAQNLVMSVEKLLFESPERAMCALNLAIMAHRTWPSNITYRGILEALQQVPAHTNIGEAQGIIDVQISKYNKYIALVRSSEIEIRQLPENTLVRSIKCDTDLKNSPKYFSFSPDSQWIQYCENGTVRVERTMNSGSPIVVCSGSIPLGFILINDRLIAGAIATNNSGVLSLFEINQNSPISSYCIKNLSTSVKWDQKCRTHLGAARNNLVLLANGYNLAGWNLLPAGQSKLVFQTTYKEPYRRKDKLAHLPLPSELPPPPGFPDPAGKAEGEAARPKSPGKQLEKKLKDKLQVAEKETSSSTPPSEQSTFSVVKPIVKKRLKALRKTDEFLNEIDTQDQASASARIEPLPLPAGLPPPPLPGTDSPTQDIKSLELSIEKALPIQPVTLQFTGNNLLLVSEDGSSLRTYQLSALGKLKLVNSFPGLTQGSEPILIGRMKGNCNIVPFKFEKWEVFSSDLKRGISRLNEMRESDDLWISDSEDSVCISKNGRLALWQLSDTTKTLRPFKTLGLCQNGELCVILVAGRKEQLAKITTTADFIPAISLDKIRILGNGGNRYWFSPSGQYLSDGYNIYNSLDKGDKNHPQPVYGSFFPPKAFFSSDERYVSGNRESKSTVFDIGKYCSTSWPNCMKAEIADFKLGQLIFTSKDGEFVAQGDLIDQNTCKQVRGKLTDSRIQLDTQRELPSMPLGAFVGIADKWLLLCPYGGVNTRQLIRYNIDTGETYVINSEPLIENDGFGIGISPLSHIPSISNDNRYVAYEKSQSGTEIGLTELCSGETLVLNQAARSTILCFSPDSKFLFVGTEKGTLNIFELRPSSIPIEPIKSFLPGPPVLNGTLSFNGRIDYIAFRDNGNNLVVGTTKEIAITPWKPDGIYKEACNRLTRNLTMEEWQEFLPNSNYQPAFPSLPSTAPKPTYPLITPY